MNIVRIASRVANVPAAEGEFAVPLGQIISTLQTLLGAKYAIEMSYRSYADRIKGLWRDALVDHWHDHAKDERDMTYDLAMKIVGLGSDPIQTMIQIPQCPANHFAFCKCLAAQELEAIKTERQIIEMAGTNTGLKVLIESHCQLDCHHIDDIRRLSSEMKE